MAAMLLPWAFLVAAVRPGLSADLVLSYIQVPTGDIRIGQEFTVKVWRSAGEFDNGGDKILLSPKGVMCGTEDSLPLPGYLAQDYVEEGNLAKYTTFECDGQAAYMQCTGMMLLQTGDYQVCLCDNDAPPHQVLNQTADIPLTGCSTLERFAFGGSWLSFSVYGVTHAGTLSMRKNVPKDLTFTGSKLSSQDRLRIVDAGVDCTSWFRGNPEDGEIAEKAWSAYVDSANKPDGQRDTGSEVSATWNDVLLTTPGSYHICWCSQNFGGCDGDEDFIVHAADLSVSGPVADTAPQACVQGSARCTLSYDGTDLSDEDRLIVINGRYDCGFADMSSNVVTTGLGASWARSSGSATRSNFGGITLSIPGTYNICWCGARDSSSGTGCTDSGEYNTLIGTVTVGGPLTGQIYRPELGKPFTYTLTGWGMSDIDQIRIVDFEVGCSTGATQWSDGVAIDWRPYGHPDEKSGPSETNRTLVSWNDIVLVESRHYTVCWCSRDYNGCTQGNHFRQDLATLIPYGPDLAVDIAAVPTMPFPIRITGTSEDGQAAFTATDRIRIVDIADNGGVCGQDRVNTPLQAVLANSTACWPSPNCALTRHNGPPTEIIDGETQEAAWYPLVMGGEGTFAVCWCSNGTNGCDHADDFLVKVATLHVAGVESTSDVWECTANEDCEIAIPFASHLDANDMVQLVLSEDSAACGKSARADESTFVIGSRVHGEAASGSTAFKFGAPKATGVYKVCYCQHAHDAVDCTQDFHFFQEVGQLSISGLENPDKLQVCYLGDECVLSIEGTELMVWDALTVLTRTQSCGSTSGSIGVNSQFSRGVDLQGSITNQQDPFLGGELITESSSGVSTWEFSIGSPLKTATYHVCYCSRGTGNCNDRWRYDQDAGELYVRGVKSSDQMEFTCTQGELCLTYLIGAEITEQDRVMLISSGETCGSSQSDLWPDWTTPVAPFALDPHTPSEAKFRAEFHFDGIRTPGAYKLCFCSHIEGDATLNDNGNLCVDDAGNPDYKLFSHQAGTVVVQGSISGVRAVEDDVQGRGLPATVDVVTVEVDMFYPGRMVTCVVTTEAAPDGFTPEMSVLEDCARDDPSATFPRCHGKATTPSQFSGTGWNQVHIPLDLDPSGVPAPGDVASLHVWCWDPGLCSNDLCVVPANNVGAVVERKNWLQQTDNAWTAVVATPFTLSLPLADNFDISQQWARAKIVEKGSSCKSRVLSDAVEGLECVEAGAGKCEPAPDLWLPETFGAGTLTELRWSGLRVLTDGVFDVCYCDRHYEQACMNWTLVGELTVQGPESVGTARYETEPQEPFDVTLRGSGFTSGDRLRIVTEGVACTALAAQEVTPVEDSEPGTNSSSRRLSVDWYSGPPSFSNSTHQTWEDILLIGAPAGVTCDICWCSGLNNVCTLASRYTVWLGKVTVDNMADCVLSDWVEAGDCSRPCDGGVQVWSRDVVTQAFGNGEACPSVLTEERPCNEDSCPLAAPQRVYTYPAAIAVDSPFQVTVEGTWLSPVADRVLIVGGDDECGDAQKHFGGAACNQYGSHDTKIVCGDGVNSITLPTAGTYRVCFCDASAAQGGCSSVGAYMLEPLEGGTFEVHDAVMPPGAEAGEDALDARILVGIGLLVSCCCMCCCACWKCFMGRAHAVDGQDVLPIEDTKPMERLAIIDSGAAQHGSAAPPGADPLAQHIQALAYYEAYYQSLGYPPGAATQAMGGPQPAMPALCAPPPAALPSHGAPQPTMLPTALPGMTPMAPAAPATPPPLAIAGPRPRSGAPSPRLSSRGGGPSPRRGGPAKSFKELIEEAKQRDAGVAFTDMGLSPMPTPTATPRIADGDVTPRPTSGGSPSKGPLAIEDGSSAEGAGGLGRPRSAGQRLRQPQLSNRSTNVSVTTTPRTSGDPPRLARSDSASSAGSLVLSETTMDESSRPNTAGLDGLALAEPVLDLCGDGMTPRQDPAAGAPPLTPVSEEPAEALEPAPSNAAVRVPPVPLKLDMHAAAPPLPADSPAALAPVSPRMPRAPLSARSTGSRAPPADPQLPAPPGAPPQAAVSPRAPASPRVPVAPHSARSTGSKPLPAAPELPPAPPSEEAGPAVAATPTAAFGSPEPAVQAAPSLGVEATPTSAADDSAELAKEKDLFKTLAKQKRRSADELLSSLRIAGHADLDIDGFLSPEGEDTAHARHPAAPLPPTPPEPAALGPELQPRRLFSGEEGPAEAAEGRPTSAGPPSMPELPEPPPRAATALEGRRPRPPPPPGPGGTGEPTPPAPEGAPPPAAPRGDGTAGAAPVPPPPPQEASAIDAWDGPTGRVNPTLHGLLRGSPTTGDRPPLPGPPLPAPDAEPGPDGAAQEAGASEPPSGRPDAPLPGPPLEAPRGPAAPRPPKRHSLASSSSPAAGPPLPPSGMPGSPSGARRAPGPPLLDSLEDDDGDGPLGDTLKSNNSMFDRTWDSSIADGLPSPKERRKHTLGGLAQTSQAAAATLDNNLQRSRAAKGAPRPSKRGVVAPVSPVNSDHAGRWTPDGAAPPPPPPMPAQMSPFHGTTNGMMGRAPSDSMMMRAPSGSMPGRTRTTP